MARDPRFRCRLNKDASQGAHLMVRERRGGSAVRPDPALRRRRSLKDGKRTALLPDISARADELFQIAESGVGVAETSRPSWAWVIRILFD